MSEVVTIFGRRGTGKSTLAAGLLQDRRRVVVFDPQWEYGRFEPVETVAELAEAMVTDWTGFRASYRPDGEGDLIAQLHEVAAAIWKVQAGFQAGTSTLEMTLAVDEANLSYPASQLPRDQRGMQRLTLQGRHRGVSLVAISQRPALVSADLRGNADRSFIFALSSVDDREAVSRQYGREHLPAITGLPLYKYIEFREGQKVPESDGETRRKVKIA